MDEDELASYAGYASKEVMDLSCFLALKYHKFIKQGRIGKFSQADIALDVINWFKEHGYHKSD